MDSDDWRIYRAVGKNKRKFNKQASTNILDESSISYNSFNGGVHLVIKHNGFVVDFWPSTGKYIFRGSNTYKRGIYNLLEDLK